MEQLYAEAGCKPKKTAKDYLIKAGLILAAVVCLGFAVIAQSFILGTIGVVGVVLIIYFIPMFNVEYEYIFCDGQIDFDKIMGGNKRKTVLKIDFDTTEIVAPLKAHQLDSYQKLKTRDFSSGMHPDKVFAAVTSVKEETVRILFEPSERMIEAMWTKSPRKVIRKV